MDPAETVIAVLFADVAGSTHLYEQLGDSKALITVARCLDTARDTAAGYGGRLIKTIGDEVMLVFPSADQAAAAAAETQTRMQKLAGTEGLRLALRIGFHLGPALEKDGDVFGDSVNVAARLVAIAKGGQIILSASTAQALSPFLRRQLRELDVVTVKGKERDIEIAELVWQDSADLTMAVQRPSLRVAELELVHQGRTLRLTGVSAVLTLGRDPQNDLVVGGKLASRHHGKIERHRDRFVLIDQSSNGTYVTFEGEREFVLRREQLMLRGRGRISLGHPHDDEPGETLWFTCMEPEQESIPKPEPGPAA